MTDAASHGDDADDIGEMVPPEIVLEVMPSYLRSLPMMVALTVRNTAPDMIYMGLPMVQWFGNPLDVRWSVQTEQGALVQVGKAEVSQHSDSGFGLDPGDERTMLVDLAALLPELPAGRHNLWAEYPVDAPVPSQPVTIDVVEINAFDAQVARAVRQGTGGTHTWREFFDRDWTWDEAPTWDRVSAPVWQAMTLHLFVHRACYGDDAIEELSGSLLKGLADGPARGEAAVLRHELLLAEGQPEEADKWKETVARQWPGLSWRCEQSEQGFGFLATIREYTSDRLTYDAEDEKDVDRP